MWGLVSFAKGRFRRLCLEALAEGPTTPSAIAGGRAVHLSHVSRALNELSRKGLVECLTPEARKNRIYGLTRKGRRLLATLRSLEKGGREGAGYEEG